MYVIVAYYRVYRDYVGIISGLYRDYVGLWVWDARIRWMRFCARVWDFGFGAWPTLARGS